MMITINKSMALPWEPALANIFTDAVETLFFSAFPLKSSIHCCNIGVIYLLWQHDNDSLTHFLERANKTHSNITFIHECSKTTLTYIDVSVQIRQDKIFTTLHKIHTDSQKYLHYTSCHPVLLKDSIIYPQFRGYKTISTRNTYFIEHSKELPSHLLHNAHTIKVIIKQ